MPVIHSPVDDARFVQLEDVIVEELGEFRVLLQPDPLKEGEGLHNFERRQLLL